MSEEVMVIVEGRLYRFTQKHLEIAEGLNLHSAARRYALSFGTQSEEAFYKRISEASNMSRSILNLMVADYIRRQQEGQLQGR